MQFFKVVLLALAVIAPELAFAQGGLVPCNGPDCDFCTAVTMAHLVGQWLVGILIILATILLAVTGVQMAMTAGNSDAKQLLKERLQNIIIGFVLILAAWVLVDTLMKALVTDTELREYWNTPIDRLCATPSPSVDTSARDPGGSEAEEGAGRALSGRTYTDAEARAVLESAGVRVKEENTSLEGVTQEVIEDAINLRSECSCEIIITGGTERGFDHSQAHLDGHKYDVRPNAALDRYIYNNADRFPHVSTRRDGTRVYQDTQTGYLYAREGDHWDIHTNP